MTVSAIGNDPLHYAMLDPLRLQPASTEPPAQESAKQAKMERLETVGEVAHVVKKVSKSGEGLKTFATDLGEAKEVDSDRFKWVKHLSKILLPLSIATVICSAIKIARVAHDVKEAREAAVSQPESASKLLTNGLIAKKITKAIVSIGKTVDKVIKKAKEFFTSNKETVKAVIEFKEIGALLLTPFAVASLVKNVVTFHKGNKVEIATQFVDIIDDTKDIGEHVTTVVSGLEEVNVLSASRVRWLKPFACVVAVLSIVEVITNVIETIKMLKLLRKIKAELNSCGAEGARDEERLKRVVDLLNRKQSKDKDFVKVTFGLKPEQFRSAFVSEALDKVDGTEKEKTASQMIRSLKGRIKSNIVSSVFSGISSTICSIGTVLLIFNPLMTAAIYLVASTLLIDIGEKIYHKAIDFRFVRKLGITRTKLDWLKA